MLRSDFLRDLSAQSAADKSSSSRVMYNLLQLSAPVGFTKLLPQILVGTDEPVLKAFWQIQPGTLVENCRIFLRMWVKTQREARKWEPWGKEAAPLFVLLKLLYGSSHFWAKNNQILDLSELVDVRTILRNWNTSL